MTRVAEPNGPLIPIDVLARRRAQTPAVVRRRLARETERAAIVRKLAELSRPIAPALVCQFPTCEDPFTVCGEPSAPGMSWCEMHRGIVFRKTEKPRDVFPYIPARGAI